jgi:hypothetical protein
MLYELVHSFLKYKRKKNTNANSCSCLLEP